MSLLIAALSYHSFAKDLNLVQITDPQMLDPEAPPTASAVVSALPTMPLKLLKMKILRALKARPSASVELYLKMQDGHLSRIGTDDGDTQKEIEWFGLDESSAVFVKLVY